MKPLERLIAPMVAAVTSLGLLAATPPHAGPARPPAAGGRAIPSGSFSRDPLDAAFRFATAIEADPNDQAMAQEQVVTELVALGRLPEAADRARRIKGWRQGTACSDVARAFAESGDAEKARALLARADAVRQATEGWEGPRIAAHMAEALVVLGDVEQSTALARDIASADPRQYSGRAAAALAGGMARKGDFPSAMARLRELDGEKDFDVSWWRTTGYLDLARRPGATAEERSEALRSARRSADGVAGWKRSEALVRIAREHLDHHKPQEAAESLTEAGRLIEPLPPTLPTKAALMTDLAAAWGLRGDKGEARRILERAEREVPEAAVIDRPGAWGAIAGTRWSIGDHKAAQSLFDRALTEAGTLVNARPRALSVVDICRSISRNRVEVEPGTQARLAALFAGLRDPW